MTLLSQLNDIPFSVHERCAGVDDEIWIHQAERMMAGQRRKRMGFNIPKGKAAAHRAPVRVDLLSFTDCGFETLRSKSYRDGPHQSRSRRVLPWVVCILR